MGLDYAFLCNGFRKIQMYLKVLSDHEKIKTCLDIDFWGSIVLQFAIHLNVIYGSSFHWHIDILL